MDIVLNWLMQYEYVAMFAILALCGVGLPLPEELTLLGSGLLVGWQEADFGWATLACCTGILMGDLCIFGLGHHYGGRFLQSRPMQLLLPAKRQARVQVFFVKHRSKALFLARFFPGVRIGVYAYAGSQRISWRRFLFLDGMGVLISCPISIWVGQWAAKRMGEDRDAAIRIAGEQMHAVGHWLLAGVASIVLLSVWGPRIWRWFNQPSRSS